MEIGPRRDLLGELAEATRTEGLKFGFYYSLYEWFNPLWKTDRARYVTEHMMPQFRDVVTRYKPSLIFSDGEWDMPSKDWNCSLGSSTRRKTATKSSSTTAGVRNAAISTAGIGQQSMRRVSPMERTPGKRVGEWPTPTD